MRYDVDLFVCLLVKKKVHFVIKEQKMTKAKDKELKIIRIPYTLNLGLQTQKMTFVFDKNQRISERYINIPKLYRHK